MYYTLTNIYIYTVSFFVNLFSYTVECMADLPYLRSIYACTQFHITVLIFFQ